MEVERVVGQEIQNQEEVVQVPHPEISHWLLLMVSCPIHYSLKKRQRLSKSEDLSSQRHVRS